MWPLWINTLPPSSNRLAEGGQRIKGQFKTGTTEEPLISYITVVKNNALLLPRAIKSVKKQTYQNVEHIILDGASTDGTIEILRNNEESIAYYASEPDNGLYHAMNKTIPLARGSIICLLNSDDWLEPEAAAIAVTHLLNKKCALLSTASKDWFGKSLIPKPVTPGTYFSCMDLCHNGIYATKEAYELAGPYDDSYRITADFKWVMICFDRKVDFFYSDKITINISPSGISKNYKLNARDTIRVIKDRFPFLEEKEIHCLYYSFYSYLEMFKPFLDFNAPSDQQAIMRNLLDKYKENSDFILSLSWALMQKNSLLQDKTPHPAGFREGIKTILRGMPFFAPCKRIFHALRSRKC